MNFLPTLCALMAICHGRPPPALPGRAEVLANAKRVFEAWALERPALSSGRMPGPATGPGPPPGPGDPPAAAEVGGSRRMLRVALLSA